MTVTMEGEAPREVGTRFVLDPAVRLPRLALYVLGTSCLLVLSWVERGLPVHWEIAVMIIGLGLFPLFAFLAMGGPNTKRIVEVLDDRLHLPFGGRGGQMLVVRYRELETLYLRPGPRGFLLIETSNVQLKLPRRVFADSDDADRMYGAIRGRVEGLIPGAVDKIAKFDQANFAAEMAYNRRPIATITAIAVLCLAYGLEHTFSTVAREYALIQVGAGSRLLIREGEFFRVASATFLHGSILHLGVVLALLYGFGRQVERLFGARSTAFLMLSAALVGNVASTFAFDFPIFCGAQPVVLAMMGSLAFVSTRNAAALPHGFRPGLTWWFLAGGTLFFLHMFSVEVDVSGELGGLLCGVVLTALVLIGPDPNLLPRMSVSPVSTIGLGITAAVTVVGLAWMVQHAPHGDADETRLIQNHLDNSLSNHYGLNVLAWRIATDPDAPRDRLELARIASARAVEGARDDNVRAALEDTHAYVLHRLGDDVEALEHELAALELVDRPFYATQVARFGVNLPPVDVPVTLVEHEHRGYGIELQANTATAATTIYAAVRAGDRVAGLLRFTIDPNMPTRTPIWLDKHDTTATWPSGVSIVPIKRRGGSSAWKAWSADPDAFELP